MTLTQKLKAIIDEAEKDLSKENQMILTGLTYQQHLKNVIDHREYILNKLKKALEQELTVVSKNETNKPYSR